MLSNERDVPRSSVIIGTIHAAVFAMRGAMRIGDVDQFVSAAAHLRAAEDELKAMAPKGVRLEIEIGPRS